MAVSLRMDDVGRVGIGCRGLRSDSGAAATMRHGYETLADHGDPATAW